jgi:hypothetical protein
VITPRQQVEGGLVGGSLASGHESTWPGATGERGQQ